MLQTRKQHHIEIDYAGIRTEYDVIFLFSSIGYITADGVNYGTWTELEEGQSPDDFEELEVPGWPPNVIPPELPDVILDCSPHDTPPEPATEKDYAQAGKILLGLEEE